jgi:hypothetical protein
MKKPRLVSTVVLSTILIVLLTLLGCGGGGSSNSNKDAVDPAEPAFAEASFTHPTQIDNQYHPMDPETVNIYQAMTEDGVETIVVEVLDETREVNGVNSRVVRDRVFLEELLIEDTHDWFAQDDAGHIWYMGETVINYEYDDEGNLQGTDNEGAWEAGQDVAGVGSIAEPGILIKATPTVGDTYQQEYYPGVAEDMAEVTAVAQSLTLTDGSSYSEVVEVREWNPLETDSEEFKYYAPGVGLIKEEAVEDEEEVELKATFITDTSSLAVFTAASFTAPTMIDNSFLPLIPGAALTYRLETDEGTETIMVEVLEDSRIVAGVECVVVHDEVFLDGVLIEDTHDWFAQDDAGNVWYMGEEVINYAYDDEGNLEETNNDGAWEAGVDGALPGIQMWAAPTVGQSYYQEFYADEAEDMALVVATGVTVTLSDGSSYENCLQTIDWNPLEPETLEYKYYAPDLGLVKEEVVGGDESVELRSDEGIVGLKAAKLLIEHNATDEDTGFQGFADGDPWNELTITDPDGEVILTVSPEGNLYGFGLTELFFETSEPANDEVPIETVLTRLSEGQYNVSGEIVDADETALAATFSHAIPEGPQLTRPADEATNVDPTSVTISWDPVIEDIDGSAVTIVGYQVIVEVDAEPAYPQGFAQATFSIYLPATATSVMVPAEFMQADTCYKYEVLAIETSGNQTLSSAGFSTGSACAPESGDEDETPELKAAKLLIEHNATDEDTGFQAFAGGDPWNQLTISGPDNASVLSVSPAGGFYNFGLTELFFETSEPENDEVSIAEVLARLPEGTYTFTGDMVGGEESTLTASFSHKIPAGPELLSPEDGATDVDPNNVVISWQTVTTDLDGQAINIVGYQVIVELDQVPQYPNGFASPVFSVYLPATATSVTVPAVFMESDESYAYEVLAIEESGNQTLSSAEFETK